MSSVVKSKAPKTSLEYLLAELRRISAQVYTRVQQIRATIPAEDEEFRGLYVSDEEIDRIFADPELFQTGNLAQPANLEPVRSTRTVSRLAYLQQVFGLSQFEVDVILIGLAPELDLRYERLYAYLQDDVTKRRPTVDLTLRLLVPGLAGQMAARRCFDAESPLVRYRLVEFNDDVQKASSMLSRVIRLDDGIVSYLLGEDRLDSRLRSFAEWASFEEAALHIPETEAYAERLSGLADQGFICMLIARDEASKSHLAGRVCQNIDKPMIRADLVALAGQPKLDQLFRLLDREVRLRNAALFVNSAHVILQDDNVSLEIRRLIQRLLREQQGLTFLSTVEALPAGLGGSIRPEYQLKLNHPGYIQRQKLWEELLGPQAAGLDLEGLTSRFRLNSGQIVGAAATARSLAQWRGDSTPTMDDLETGCRIHSSQKLSGLAKKVIPNYTWNDIVLPPDQYSMLREIVQQVKNRLLVYERWGFDRKLSLGKGLNVVFAGPSGTGKTMSAEIIAKELSMDLYKIDLSSMVSKYIGETEKNLEKIFNEAGDSSAILFFDEADSLFGKRSEVKDAHDRYANIETSYLLQKMEEYDGIVVLATNLRKNLDEAFVRRMHFMIEFPFPEEEDRFEIWRKAFPKEVPMGENVDLRFMARQFKLAGGNIKNTALATAFLAAGDPNAQCIEMPHLIRAIRREYQKLGKLCTESDFGPYYYLVREYDPKQRVSGNGLRPSLS